MTVASAGHAPASKGSRHAPSRLARWGVALAAFAAIAIAASFAVFAVAYASGGSGATEDNWVGYLAGLSLLGGLPTSFVALTPALVAILVLGEAFLWE